MNKINDEIKKSQKNTYLFIGGLFCLILMLSFFNALMTKDFPYITIPFIFGLWINRWHYKNQEGIYSPIEHIKFIQMQPPN